MSAASLCPHLSTILCHLSTSQCTLIFYSVHISLLQSPIYNIKFSLSCTEWQVIFLLFETSIIVFVGSLVWANRCEESWESIPISALDNFGLCFTQLEWVASDVTGFRWGFILSFTSECSEYLTSQFSYTCEPLLLICSYIDNNFSQTLYSYLILWVPYTHNSVMFFGGFHAVYIKETTCHVVA